MQPHPEITLGRRLRRLDLAELSVSEVAYAPDTEMPPHAHRNANISLMLGGDCEEVVDGHAHQIRPLHLVFKPGGTEHCNRYGTRGARSMIIELHAGSFLSDALQSQSKGHCRWLCAMALAGLALRTFRRALCQRAATGEERDALVGGVADLLGSAGRERGDAPRLRRTVRDARALLQEGFREAMSLQRVAEHVGVHPVYLARAFREQLGCSPTDYRRRLQVAEAARRLSETREPLGLVALAAGFADQSHLTRVFHATVGVTPAHFRRELAL